MQPKGGTINGKKNHHHTGEDLIFGNPMQPQGDIIKGKTTTPYNATPPPHRGGFDFFNAIQGGIIKVRVEDFSYFILIQLQNNSRLHCKKGQIFQGFKTFCIRFSSHLQKRNPDPVYGRDKSLPQTVFGYFFLTNNTIMKSTKNYIVGNFLKNLIYTFLNLHL